MMRTTRRHVLQGLAGGAAALGLAGAGTGLVATGRAEAPAGLALEIGAERPLPELVAKSALPVLPVDVEASRQALDIVLKDGRKIGDTPEGCIASIPAGAEIPLHGWRWRVKANNHGYLPGARLILRGEAGGKRPMLFTADPKDVPRSGGKAAGLILGANNAGFDLPVGFEIENLHLNSIHFENGSRTEALRTGGVRFTRVSDSVIEGGRNCVFFAQNPSIALFERSEIKHGGLGDGLTHCIYSNYIEAFVVRDCKIHSAKPFGVPFKCYAKFIDMRDSTVANWLDFADLEGGYTSGYPALDLGAWATTLLVNNRFIRRGPPIRQTCVDYRNRQWPIGKNRYVQPGWGTTTVPYQEVDNRDPENSHLFRHLLANNQFVNGILPDGSLDPHVRDKPGIAVRNNGTGTWASHGGGDIDKSPKPPGWRKHHERAVVWAVANRFEGVPFNQHYDQIPYKRPEDFGPILETDTMPAWADQLMDRRSL